MPIFQKCSSGINIVISGMRQGCVMTCVCVCMTYDFVAEEECLPIRALQIHEIGEVCRPDATYDTKMSTTHTHTQPMCLCGVSSQLWPDSGVVMPSRAVFLTPIKLYTRTNKKRRFAELSGRKQQRR